MANHEDQPQNKPQYFKAKLNRRRLLATTLGFTGLAVLGEACGLETDDSEKDLDLILSGKSVKGLSVRGLEKGEVNFVDTDVLPETFSPNKEILLDGQPTGISLIFARKNAGPNLFPAISIMTQKAGTDYPPRYALRYLPYSPDSVDPKIMPNVVAFDKNSKEGIIEKYLKIVTNPERTGFLITRLSRAETNLQT